MNLLYAPFDQYIVILTYTNKSITNEDRVDIIDKKYAKYEGTNLQVLQIKNKHTKNPHESVEADNIRITICDIIIGPLMYFLSDERAYNYEGCYYCQHYKDKPHVEIPNGEHKEWYNNGQLHMKGNHKNNKREGYFCYYDRHNGHKYMEGYYKNNKRVLDKTWKYFYPNGSFWLDEDTSYQTGILSFF